MDFKLKQWRNQHESKRQHSSNVPKLLFEFEPHQASASAQVLPFFVPDSNTKVSTLSALSDSTLPATRFPRMGCYYFSFAQWQELELQALIFRYIISGAPVPPQLLQPIRKSFLHSPPCFLQHPLQHYHPALLESRYWGRAALDPEPGRCRRTDGKKWQCSRDVVAGQKYYERHLRRGRNHSRKPVEQCDDGVVGGSLGVTTFISSPHSLPPASFKSPFDLHQLKERFSGSKNDRSLFENQDHEGWSDGHILKHFFDD